MRTLRTARLQLRAVTANDLVEVHAASNGPAASALSPQAIGWIARMASNQDPRLGGGWSFRHGLTRRLVGFCLYFSGRGEAAEISYIVSPAYRRRGYCTEAMVAILGELFREAGFVRIYADVAADNAASQRVLARLGFSLQEGDAEPVHVGVDRRPARRHQLTAQDHAARGGVTPEGRAAGEASGLTSP